MTQSPNQQSTTMMVHLGVKIPIKISMAGDSNVGKTSLVSQYVSGEFKENYRCTIGAVYNDIELTFEDGYAHVQIWDTAGQERYKSLVPMYFRDSDIVFLLFDVSDRKSFTNLGDWLDLIYGNVETTNLNIVVIGNKNDLVEKRSIKYSEAEEFCRLHNLKYYETSAKTNNNVEECFREAIEIVYRQLKEQGILKKENDIDQDMDKIEKKCCHK